MQTLVTPRLRLEPLVAAHADAMFPLLSDLRLCEHLDDAPPASLAELRERCGRLETRLSTDGREQWLNWVLIAADSTVLGFVQATVGRNASAWVAYELAFAHWGRGLAGEAVASMLEHLAASCGVLHFKATVEVANRRSIRLLERLGFRAADAAQAQKHELTPTERLYLR